MRIAVNTAAHLFEQILFFAGSGIELIVDLSAFGESAVFFQPDSPDDPLIFTESVYNTDFFLITLLLGGVLYRFGKSACVLRRECTLTEAQKRYKYDDCFLIIPGHSFSTSSL